MDKTKLLQRLMATFLEELDEHVRSLNRDLLDLEKNPAAAERADRFKTLFRTAHSLKGAARSVNVSVMERACHRLEEILAAVRDGLVTLDAGLFGLLFATVDALEEAGMRLREQQDLTDAPLTALVPRLEAAAAGAPFAPPPRSSVHLSEFPAVPAPIEPAPDDKVVPTPETKVVQPPAGVRSDPFQVSAPPEPAANETALEAAPAAASLRVSAEKLDTLLAHIGELLVARRRLESRLSDLKTLQEFVEHWRTDWHRVEKVFEKLLSGAERGPRRDNGPPARAERATLVLRQTGDNLRRLNKDLDRLATVMNGDSRLLEQVAGPLDDEVRRVRMLPFADACAGLDRLARDLAQAEGKEVELRLDGGNVELDRSILEGLKDPLRHLVRNAIDHGLETPAQRQQAGKPRQGRVAVAAALRGSQVEVTVQDDGRGLDLDALRDQARRRRLAEPKDERELARLVFLPGLSTASLITDISGRGVGLDVVKSRVESLHGTVDLAFQPSAGTSFTLTVPLTLTTLRAVLVQTAGQTFAFAGTNVHKLVRASAADLRLVAGQEMLALGGPPIPYASLAAVLQLGAFPGATAGKEGETPHPGGKTPVLIIAAGDKRMAFAVDEFVAEQEILIKNLGTRIRHVPLIAGATLLPSGRIALVLNAANVVRNALQRPSVPEMAAPAGPALVARKRLLVVEDSVTTRTLEKSILEAAGYEVATAVDGQAALEFLQDHETDLIVSDVEMPRMDGFALTEALRASKRLARLPVVLVTARETDQDKSRGLAVGADAYLVKSAFDQRNLLETIAQLL